VLDQEEVRRKFKNHFVKRDLGTLTQEYQLRAAPKDLRMCRDMRALKKALRCKVQQLLKELTAEKIAEECIFSNILLVVYLTLVANSCATNLF